MNLPQNVSTNLHGFQTVTLTGVASSEITASSDAEDTISNATNATLSSQTTTKPNQKSKFGKLMSSISHSKSSNDINSNTISGNVSLPVNAASNNFLNASNINKSSSTAFLEKPSKNNKHNNVNNANSMMVSAVRLLSSLTGGPSANSTNFKMPKSFSSFSIKQSGSNNNDFAYQSKFKNDLTTSMVINRNHSVTNSSKLSFQIIKNFLNFIQSLEPVGLLL